jgi:hypothetical protein
VDNKTWAAPLRAAQHPAGEVHQQQRELLLDFTTVALRTPTGGPARLTNASVPVVMRTQRRHARRDANAGQSRAPEPVSQIAVRREVARIE